MRLRWTGHSFNFQVSWTGHSWQLGECRACQLATQGYNAGHAALVAGASAKWGLEVRCSGAVGCGGAQLVPL